jgi:peroxiredoxin Q/BCP
MTIKIGEKVPAIIVVDQDNQKLKLTDFKGKYVVLYFYPKDNTPGCTLEAKDFRDSIAKFEQLNTVVLGVSKDDCRKHQKFIADYDLPFSLLVDADGALCQEFAVWAEKSMFGKKYMGIVRSTFIIDPNSKLVAEWRNVKVTDHVKDVLKVLSEIVK